MTSPRPTIIATSPANDEPVSMLPAQRSRGYLIPEPPASAVRRSVPALVISGVTTVADLPPRRRHVAADCDYCLTGERHPAQMF